MTCSTFTDEVALHLDGLGIEHTFELGDLMVVLDDRRERKFPIRVGNPSDPKWRAWIFAVIACNARDAWLNTRKILADKEREQSAESSIYLSEAYINLSTDERQRFWREQFGEEDYSVTWKILVESVQEPPNEGNER